MKRGIPHVLLLVSLLTGMTPVLLIPTICHADGKLEGLEWNFEQDYEPLAVISEFDTISIKVNVSNASPTTESFRILFELIEKVLPGNLIDWMYGGPTYIGGWASQGDLAEPGFLDTWGEVQNTFQIPPYESQTYYALYTFRGPPQNADMEIRVTLYDLEGTPLDRFDYTRKTNLIFTLLPFTGTGELPQDAQGWINTNKPTYTDNDTIVIEYAIPISTIGKDTEPVYLSSWDDAMISLYDITDGDILVASYPLQKAKGRIQDYQEWGETGGKVYSISNFKDGFPITNYLILNPYKIGKGLIEGHSYEVALKNKSGQASYSLPLDIVDIFTYIGAGEPSINLTTSIEKIPTTPNNPLPIYNYNIAYTNTGFADAYEVVIAEKIPIESTYVKGSAGYNSAGTKSISPNIVQFFDGTTWSNAEPSDLSKVQSIRWLWDPNIIAANDKRDNYGPDEGLVGFQVTPKPGMTLSIKSLGTASVTYRSKDEPPRGIAQMGISPSPQEQKQGVITFDRVLAGDKVGQHKAPPTTQVEMTVAVNTSEELRDAVLTDYFPKGWTVTDSKGGAISEYTMDYNRIVWQLGTITGKITKSYLIKSPELTIPPVKYYFQTGLEYRGGSNKSEQWMVVVSDPVNLGNSTKSVDNTNPIKDTNITYTITVENSGNIDATNVTVTDTIPTNSTYVANSVTLNGAAKTDASDADEVTVSSGTITVNVGTVVKKIGGVSGTATITFQVTASGSVGQTIANSATITYTGGSVIVTAPTVTIRANAVTSAVAEITPTSVTTGTTGQSFTYSIFPTISGSDTGVNQIKITVPSTYSSISMNTSGAVTVAGSGVTYTRTIASNVITVDLTTKVTTNQVIAITFTATTPSSADSGTNFTSTVDDTGTSTPTAQNASSGDGDNGSNGGSWTVTASAYNPAVTSAVAEISPTSVVTNTAGQSFTYSIFPTVGTGTGINQVNINVPSTYSSISVTSVKVGGVTHSTSGNPATRYTNNSTGNTIIIDFTQNKTGNSVIEIKFTATTPSSADSGTNFTSSVDDTGTSYSVQNTTEGDGDNIGNGGSWKVTVGTSNSAVTSAVAEITPNSVRTSSTGNVFTYSIFPQIGASNTGVDEITISVPSTHTSPSVTTVKIDGSSVSFTNNSSGNTIRVTLTTKVTSNKVIAITFTANAPSSSDSGVNFTSTVDDTGTASPGSQNTTEGDGDNKGDGGDWTVISGQLAVTSALAEISPNSITAGSTAVAFTYDILPTIGASDTGIDQVKINVPSTYSNITLTGVSVGGIDQSEGTGPASKRYSKTISSNVITITFAQKKTATDTRITITFTADAPSSTDSGQNFTSTLDDTSTSISAQTTSAGNADGDASDNNSITVTAIAPSVSAEGTGVVIATSRILEGGTIYVRVKDIDLKNGSSFKVTMVRNTNIETEELQLAESPSGTGIFTNTAGMPTVKIGPTKDNDGSFRVSSGDTIVTTYTDASPAGSRTATTKVVSSNTSTTGSVSVKDSTFTNSITAIKPADTLSIEVTDSDLGNNSGANNDNAFVTVTTTNGDSEIIFIKEDLATANRFRATLTTASSSSPVANNDKLEVTGGDKITVTYIDSLDANDLVNQSRTATVSVITGTGIANIIEVAISPGDTLNLEVLDADLSGSVGITLMTTNGDSETVSLNETSTQGVFKGTFSTVHDTAKTGNGTLDVQEGDTITLIYNDSSPKAERKDTCIVITISGTGVAKILEGTVSPDDTITGLVADSDLNTTSGGNNDTVSVRFMTADASNSSLDDETLILNETTTPGLFTGTITTKDSFSVFPSSGTLEVIVDDTITLEYIDAKDLGGKKNQTRSDSITVTKRPAETTPEVEGLLIEAKPATGEGPTPTTQKGIAPTQPISSTPPTTQPTTTEQIVVSPTTVATTGTGAQTTTQQAQAAQSTGTQTTTQTTESTITTQSQAETPPPVIQTFPNQVQTQSTITTTLAPGIAGSEAPPSPPTTKASESSPEPLPGPSPSYEVPEMQRSEEEVSSQVKPEEEKPPVKETKEVEGPIVEKLHEMVISNVEAIVLDMLPTNMPSAIITESGFTTDAAMYCSSEFFLTGITKIISLDELPNLTILAQKSHEYLLANIKWVSFQQGMGIKLEYDKDTIQRYLAQSNLKNLPQNFKPIIAEYTSSNTTPAKDLLLQKVEKVISPGSLGSSLIAQTLTAREHTGKSDWEGFLGLSLGLEMSDKVQFISDRLFFDGKSIGSLKDKPTGYIPHRIKIIEKEGKLNLEVSDKSSYLIDYAYLIWGMSEYLKAFKNIHSEGDVSGTRDRLIDLNLALYNVIRVRHYDSNTETFIDTNNGKKGTRVSLANAALSIVGLASFYESITDPAIARSVELKMKGISKDVKTMVIKEADFIVHKLQAATGEFHDGHLEGRALKKEGASISKDGLLIQVSGIRGLLAAWRLTGNKKYLEGAKNGFDYMDKNFRDESLMIYKSSLTTDDYIYTPINVGMTVGALREMSNIEGYKDLALSRLSRFFGRIVEDAGLINIAAGKNIIKDTDKKRILKVAVKHPATIPLLNSEVKIKQPVPENGKTETFIYDLARSNVTDKTFPLDSGMLCSAEFYLTGMMKPSQRYEWTDMPILTRKAKSYAIENIKGLPKISDGFNKPFSSGSLGAGLLGQVLMSGIFKDKTGIEKAQGLELGMEMSKKIALLHDKLFFDGSLLGSLKDMPNSYIPHLITGVVKDGKLNFEVSDKTSILTDYAYLAWGLGEYLKICPPNIKAQVMNVGKALFSSIKDRHYDSDMVTLIDVHYGKKSSRISMSNAALSIVGLVSLYDGITDPEVKSMIIKEADFIVHKLQEPEGEFSDGYWITHLLRKEGAETSKDGLLIQSSGIRGLLAAWQLTGDNKYLEGAKKGFDYMDKNFWDENLMIYRSSLTTGDYTYTPVNMGMTIGALREMSNIEGYKDLALSRLSRFFDRIVEDAGLINIANPSPLLNSKIELSYPLNKGTGKLSAGIGDTILYKITVQNTGIEPARGIALKVTFPEGVRLAETTGIQGGSVWQITELQPNKSFVLTFKAEVKETTEPGEKEVIIEVIKPVPGGSPVTIKSTTQKITLK